MTSRTGRARTLAVAAAAVLAAAGCATPSRSAQPDQIVLADAGELGGFNPVSGYGESGVSPIYESLFRPHSATDDTVPDLFPALAGADPEPVGPGRWRIALRGDVTFSDGSTLNADDVVATYAAVKDPRVASPIATNVAPVNRVSADGDDAVIVDVDATDPKPFLLLGILPSEKVEPGPAADWAVNTEPVGTGPYRLERLRPDQAVLVARDDYWGEPPQVRRLVYTYTPDDNTRAQRIVAGEVDGANLPPRLVDSVGDGGVETVAVQSADWRAVSLPAGNVFTADPAARLAMNHGVDRDAVVRDVLAGYGRPASTPIAEVYGAAYEPAAQFGFDIARATTLLDQAGWRPGPGGVREKFGDRASFELLYNAQDTLRRDVAVAFAAAMRPLGIEVRPRGTSWDEIDTRFADAAVVLGGGSTPYSIDSQVYDTLHTRVPDSSLYSNPGNFTAPRLDELLEEARRTAPGARKDAVYRQIQSAYAQQPSHVFVAFVDHTYAYRDTGWRQVAPILEPHAHGVSWGPWWDLAAWTR
ncbi:ABC transporter substrate-binding protein [Mycobacterium sp. PS03-16]|uniref:ABC transporter substrate-binding protein n=1 Tax=Mycobacterium sp. PS03-16 TaxID=2559611 RepID=UPI0010732B64|nr:ABC transporter substrate-binding protein [Mycobacterium sp. PS03-16]TFV54809.1 ABC transporter substrate-binding protein [Mycobacterium sp. PS03-16]